MPPQIIFCPKCHTLILVQAACPKCQWERSSVAPLRGEGKELWQFNVEAKLNSAPVIDGNLLFISAENGNLFALDLDARRPIWTITLNNGEPSERVAVAGGRMFYGEITAHDLSPFDKCLVAVDARTNAESWRVQTNAMSVSSPAVLLGTVYATSSGRTLHAVDALTGKNRFAPVTLPGAWSPAAPLATVSTIYVPARDKVLTALDAQTGELRWTFAANGWLPTTPTLADDVLYVSSWDNFLYALDAQTGKVIWKFTPTDPKTAKPSSRRFMISAPTVTREVVFVGCYDKQLYVVERATGKEVRRIKVGRVNAPPLLLGETFVIGSEDHRLAAYHAKTYEFLWAFDAGAKIKTALTAREGSLFAAARNGKVFEVQWQSQPTDIAPDVLEQRGELENAANVYALRGNPVRAAELYAQMHRWHEAAQLYRHAQQLELAAQNFERAHDRDSAITVWRELNQARRVAELLEQDGKPEQAAPIYEGLARNAATPNEAKPLFTKAATLFEQTRQFAKACDLYELAGNLPRAKELARQLGDDERTARVLERDGDYRNAADLWRKRDPLKAAELYAQAGGDDNIRQAIALYKERGSPELLLRARELASDHALLVELGEICLRLDDKLNAARAFERAAGDLELRQPPVSNPRPIIELYARAETLFAELDDEPHRKHCQSKVRQHRKHPDLEILINPIVQEQSPYRQGEDNYISVLVKNVGHGPANAICISVSGNFESTLACVETIEKLFEGKDHKLQVDVRPKNSGLVRLDILAEYTAQDGTLIRGQATVRIPVLSAQPAHVAYSINVTGDMVQGGGAKYQTGDIGYANFAQRRDKPANDVCPRCQATVAREYQFCNACGADLRPSESADTSA